MKKIDLTVFFSWTAIVYGCFGFWFGLFAFITATS